MLYNYFKTALRNIVKYRSYSLINIFGLAASTAICILLVYYSYHVLTYDQFHEKSEDIYYLYRDRPATDGNIPVYDTWYPLAEELQNNYPEIASVSRVLDGGGWVEYEDNRFRESMYYVDSTFFTMFSFPLIKGDPQMVLNDPYSAVISRDIAKKYFGDEDPIGKVLRLDLEQNYTVTGVLGDIPPNSSFEFSLVLPLHKGLPFMEGADWNSSFFFSFVELKPQTDINTLSAKFPEFVEKYIVESERGNILLMPLKDYNDTFTNQRRYAYILMIIALGILLIAAINFTNLATAQSLLRTKEVGVRKVLGASRGTIMQQYMLEAMMLSFTALLLGLAMADLLQPFFNDLVGMELRMPFLSDGKLIFAVLGLGILMGLLSGGYPAFFLASLKPQSMFKSSTKFGSKNYVRNALVTLQFGLAIILISGMGVIIQQISYMKTQDLNFGQDHVMVIPLSFRNFENGVEGLQKVQVFKNEINQISGVRSVAASSCVPGRYPGWFGLYLAEGQEDRDPFDWRNALVDDKYFDAFEIEMVEGRNFRENSEKDQQESIIINEAAMKAIGWNSAVGKKLMFPGTDRGRTIVGVVKDFHYRSLAEPIQPLVHFYRGAEHNNYRFITVKIEASAFASVIDDIKDKLDDLGTLAEVSYFFPDEHFATLYENEENMSRIMGAATILAIIIACLGLYALASFVILQRTKEIAIRKVLGASGMEIAYIVSKSFAQLILIAFLFAAPISYLLSQDWLQDFNYRMSLGPGLFVFAGLTAFVISLMTVSYHAIKATRVDPIRSLRYE